jgi:hypothetical protein
MLMPVNQPWRLKCYHIAVSLYYEWLMYFIILLNVIETIIDWAISGSAADFSWQAEVFLYMNLSFMLLYTVEAIVKVRLSFMKSERQKERLLRTIFFFKDYWLEMEFLLGKDVAELESS